MRSLLLFCFVPLLGGCRGGDVPAADAVRPVKTETASDAAFIDRDFVGLATPDDAVNLAFKLS